MQSSLLDGHKKYNLYKTTQTKNDDTPKGKASVKSRVFRLLLKESTHCGAPRWSGEHFTDWEQPSRRLPHHAVQFGSAGLEEVDCGGEEGERGEGLLDEKFLSVGWGVCMFTLYSILKVNRESVQ